MTVSPLDPGPRPELTWLPVDHLDIDPTYQRTIDTLGGRRLIAKIAGNFRWAAFQAILATPSPNPDRWLIIDGQHRVAAAKQIGLSLVPAVVVQGADVASQAIAFVAANRDRVPVSTQAVFHARLAAGDSDALTIARLCKAAGVEILAFNQTQRQVPAGKTTATGALMSMLRVHGEEIAGEAIAAVAGRYGQEQGGLRAPFFLAAGLFLRAGGTPEALKESLSRFELRQLINVNIAGGPVVMAREIVGMLRGEARRELVTKQTRVPVVAYPVAPFRAPSPALGNARFRDDALASRDHGSPGPRR